MLKKIGAVIFTILAIIFVGYKLYNIFAPEPIENTPLSVGACVANNSDYDHIECDNPAAAYKVTAKTDSEGSTCNATTDTAVIYEEYTMSSKNYFCVAALAPAAPVAP